MGIIRRKSREVNVGNITIGGNAEIPVQTMTKAAPTDFEGIMAQIKESADLGCQIIRLAVPNKESLKTFAEVKKNSPIPLVADIHFNEQLALGALEAGADKIRINPGNMKNWEALQQVVNKTKELGRAMRIGVNSGSIRHGNSSDNRPMADALAEEALYYIERIEQMGFTNFVVSLKANDAPDTIAANLAVADKMDYPLHLGVTAAGPEEDSMLKSAVGVGGLLAQGIGDTIRLSFTGSPASEVKAGFELLRAVGILKDRVNVFSCPTCGRCKVDLQSMVKRAKEKLSHIKVPISVAVMGCEVNGPGEAKEADIGIAAGKGKYAMFKNGELVKTIPEDEALDVLVKEVEAMLACQS
jgi:(E)-4-hydroxy-3-methylbut-2-enyl-diphosphate synthase